TPSVVLADRRDQTDEIRRVILARDRQHVIGEVTTLDDFLPGDLETQRKKLALLYRLRTLCKDTDAELCPPDTLRPLVDADLPPSLTRLFRTREPPLPSPSPDGARKGDGALGRIVLVYHGAHVSVWDGHQLERIAALLEEIPLADGTVVRSSGQAVVFTAMIRSITSDAPIATGVSLGGVALLVLLLAGARGALRVLTALLAGVAWMLGAAALVGARTNFLNFIALPITFGIGVDYAVNIWLRWRSDGDIARTVRTTGSAVMLCSLTTVIGYGALLVADNQALRSFGTLAILGEGACLLAALWLLPAWISRAKTPARRGRG
ncbi:MAG TPA: MMPL family transporter, partial [Kofleriaceae bacterium]|nr:MMPL family transporter [Kofleriaceae bacterium]